MYAIPMHDLLKYHELLGEDKGNALQKDLLNSEFRSATSLQQQIDFLNKEHPKLIVRVIIKLLGIYNDKYYRATRNDENSSSLPACSLSQRLLSDIEENDIIAKTHVYQMQNDCLDGQGIRSTASEICAKRTFI